MSPSPPGRNAVWLLPIVLALCALMVLPASAMLQSHSAVLSPPSAPKPPLAAASTPPLASSSAVGTQGSSGNQFLSLNAASMRPTIPSAAPGASAAYASYIQKAKADGASPAKVAMLEKLASGIQSGAIKPNMVNLPNIDAFLGIPASPPSAPPTQFYTQAPAPMGVADYGIGGATGYYEYNTSSILGTANFTSFNATGGSFYEPTGSYYYWGLSPNLPGNPYEFGIQENTIVDNITLENSTNFPLGSGVFWAQNVPEFFGNTIIFADEVWNFSSLTAAFPPSTVYNSTGIVDGTGLVYDDELYTNTGPTVPVVYPYSLQLYNNATTLNDSLSGHLNKSAISFGYRLIDGNGKVYGGTYDTIVFNSPIARMVKTKTFTPLNPQYRVDGFVATPITINFDAEIDLCGPADGSNAMITNASGTMTLEYLPSGSSTFVSVPAAFDYGGETGETSYGAAVYYSGHTAYVNQGPSLLYGLWGTGTKGATTGDLQFTGQSSPIYAFTFIGGSATLQAWAPSNAAGVVNTYLPPTIPGSTAYYVSAYAAEYADFVGPTFAATITDYAITMTALAGHFDAPLYMNGEAQATALADAIDGAGATAPYAFKNIVDKVGVPFNLLNDYAFPMFNLLYATGLTSSIAVSHVAQGPNSATATDFFYPYTDVDCTTGDCTFNLPNATQAFVDYGGKGDTFTNLELPGFLNFIGLSQGGVISLWGTQGVVVDNATSTDFSFGVWDSASSATTDEYSYAKDAVDLSVLASSGAVGRNLSSNDFGLSIFDEGGIGGTFTYTNASFLSEGYESYWANGTTIDWTRVNESVGLYVVYGIGLTVNHLWCDQYDGALVFGATTTTVTNALFFNDTFGILLYAGATATVSDVNANDSLGVAFEYSFAEGTVSKVVAVNGSLGVGILESEEVTVTTVGAYALGPLGGSDGVEVLDTPLAAVSITGITATGEYAPPVYYLSVGVLIQNSSDVTISTVTASNDAGGVEIFDSSDITVTSVTASSHADGVVVDPSTDVSISSTTATELSIGTLIDDSTAITVSATSSSTESLGDEILNSTQVTDTEATTTDLSTGIFVEGSTFVSVSGSRATNATLTGLFATSFTGLPITAILTEDDASTIITNVSATDYGAALLDYDSDGLQVSYVASTAGQYAVALNGTFNSYLTGIGAYEDYLGLALGGDYYATDDNYISNSSFVDETSYGVWIYDGEDNTLTGNSFIDDNGATSTYSPAHIQAWSGEVNHFYVCTNAACTTGVGNYWADWHTYGANGYLAPYIVTGTTEDLFPIGPEETFTVNFNAAGLPAGTVWSVSLDGVTESSATATISFAEPMGTYDFRVGSLSGWTSTPSSGSVTVAAATYNVSVTFSATLYALTLSEGGLSAGTAWSATVSGVTQSTAGTSLVFYLPDGKYAYAFNAVSGYNLPSTGASGSVSVSGAPTSLATTYSPTSTPSVASTSSLNDDFGVALAIAVIALLVGLVALFWRRRKPQPTSVPPTAWTPPTGTTGEASTTTGGTPGSGSPPGWSEGPPAPPTPPS